MLDIECFTYLNRALESPIAPIVVLASNRGMCAIRGTDGVIAAHGVPTDFLARLLVIPTHPYNADEIRRIVRIRCTAEGVSVSDAAIDKIADHGVRISLRYCLQLLTPARCVSLVLFYLPPRFRVNAGAIVTTAANIIIVSLPGLMAVARLALET